MKSKEEIEEKIKFLEQLIENGNEDAIMRTNQRFAINVKINILKWVLDEN